MKRLLLTTVAALMIAGPMALPASAQQGNYRSQPQGHDDHDRYDNDRHDNYRHDNDRHDNDRHDGRWEQSQHNGYYVGRAWHAGPPSARIVRRSDYRPAYKAWARGDRLGYYNQRYVVVDYRAHRLNRPQRGYHWVQDDRGDYILAAVAGGLIASVILNASH